MARVLLSDVTKRYGKILAVDRLNLDVRDGEFLVLVGPSGCGKSTVLRLIAGLEVPDSGIVYIDGEPMNKVHPRDRNVAMVFESPSYALYPGMTAYDNVAFSLRIRMAKEAAPGEGPAAEDAHPGETPREGAIRKRVEGLADKLGLHDYLHRKPDQLSAGHRQTVALERAMVREPRVFLMDDPLSQLDAHRRATACSELRKMHRELGVTTVYVTHDQAEAMSLGDRIAVMDNGMLQQIGTSRALYDRPANTFVAGFIGSPAMNMINVWLEYDGQDLYMLGPGFKLQVPEYYAQRLSDRGNMILGLRPESIHDARFAPDAGPESVVSTRVELSEYIGTEVYLHLLTGNQQLVARMDQRTTARRGDALDVVFDLANMHAFNPVSQRTLL